MNLHGITKMWIAICFILFFIFKQDYVLVVLLLIKNMQTTQKVRICTQLFSHLIACAINKALHFFSHPTFTSKMNI